LNLTSEIGRSRKPETPDFASPPHGRFAVYQWRFKAGDN